MTKYLLLLPIFLWVITACTPPTSFLYENIVCTNQSTWNARTEVTNFTCESYKIEHDYIRECDAWNISIDANLSLIREHSHIICHNVFKEDAS